MAAISIRRSRFICSASFSCFRLPFLKDIMHPKTLYLNRLGDAIVARKALFTPHSVPHLPRFTTRCVVGKKVALLMDCNCLGGPGLPSAGRAGLEHASREWWRARPALKEYQDR